MSLVPTYVQGSDGKWYKNPVIGERDWFLCYNDDEPIELVIEREEEKDNRVWKFHALLAKLAVAGYKLKQYGTRYMRASRCFRNRAGFIPADAYFLQPCKGSMPVSLLQHHDGCTDELPKGECIFYPKMP